MNITNDIHRQFAEYFEEPEISKEIIGFTGHFIGGSGGKNNNIDVAAIDRQFGCARSTTYKQS